MSLILTLDAPDLEGAAIAEQGSQTADAAGGMVFGGAVVTGQAQQTIDAQALLQFITAGDTAQGGQSAADTALEIFIGIADTGQGAQVAQIQGYNGEEDTEPKVFQDGGVAVRLVRKKTDRGIVLLLPVHGRAGTVQAGQSAAGTGEVIPLQDIEGEAFSEQPSAQVIAIGSVDNRRPRNLRKAKIAAVLFAA